MTVVKNNYSLAPHSCYLGSDLVDRVREMRPDQVISRR